MNGAPTDLLVLAVPLLALGVAVVTLTIDLVLPAEVGAPPVPPQVGTQRRGVGAAATAGLLLLLAATWLLPVGGTAFGGAYVQDAFTLFVQRLLLAAAALGTLGSIDHADREFPTRQGEYFLLMLLSLVGMLVLAGARELVLLVVSFELMGIPLYVLAAMHKKSKGAVEGALKLYLTGAVSSAVTLYGLSFVIGSSGSTQLSALGASAPTPLFHLGLLLAVAGMSFKVGAVPFHMWIPDTYQGSASPFVAWLSVAPKTAGFAAFVRLFIEGLGGHRDTWWPVLLVVATVTMIVGNLLAVPQTSVKRLLGYSGIAHIGLMLIAFGLATTDSIGALLFYLAAYTFTNMGAFLVVEVVSRGTPGQPGTDELAAWRGLSRRSPTLGLAMLIFLLSLGGIPFVAGFWAKLFLFWAAWEAGMGLIVVLGASLAVLGLFYYLRVARSIYIEEPDPQAAGPLPAVGLPTAVAIAIALIGTVGLGLWPHLLLDAAMAAARSVIGG